MRPEHAISAHEHSHSDPKSLSSRLMFMTGYRPDPATLTEMIVQEAKTFQKEEFHNLLEKLNAIAPPQSPATQ